MIGVAGRRAAIAPHSKHSIGLGNPVTSRRQTVKTPATRCWHYNRPSASAVDSIPCMSVASDKFGILQSHDQHLTTYPNMCSTASVWVGCALQDARGPTRLPNRVLDARRAACPHRADGVAGYRGCPEHAGSRVRITSTFQADDGHEYEILSDSLGAGAQGTVRRGRRVADDRPVAIAGRGPEANRELQIALKLHWQDSQHLLVPLTWAIDGADLLLVMPLADHGLAVERASHENGLAEDALLPVLRDITSGLAELHAAGIVHRDLKPDNVLFYEGRWCVADFGISRDLDVRTATLTFKDHGTAPYVAPERWRAQPATHKSDLYALGGIAHELATGHTVFTGDQDTQRHHHLHTPPPAAPVGPALARWISRLLDKDPARRPQDPAAALTTLPQAPAAPGRLAAAAWRAQQVRSQHAATQGQAMTRRRGRRRGATAGPGRLGRPLRECGRAGAAGRAGPALG